MEYGTDVEIGILTAQVASSSPGLSGLPGGLSGFLPLPCASRELIPMKIKAQITTPKITKRLNFRIFLIKTSFSLFYFLTS
jgi:hypothetical protein